MGYNCDSDDGNAAALLITDLTAGETLALCPLCLPAWVNVMNHELNPDDAPPAAAVPTSPVTGDESDDDGDADGVLSPVSPEPVSDPDAGAQLADQGEEGFTAETVDTALTDQVIDRLDPAAAAAHGL